MCQRLSLGGKSKGIVLLLFVVFLLASMPLSAKKYPSVHSSVFLHKNAVTGFAGFGAIDGFAGATGMVEYERFPGQSGMLGLNLKAGVFNSGTTGTVQYEQTRVSLLGIYLAPGARYHFFGNSHYADLSAGLSLPMGNLHLKEDYIEGGGYVPKGEDFEKNYFLFAALADITVDLHRPHGRVFGFFAKTGGIVANARATHSNNVDPFYLTIGIRFGGIW
jgi:hypothetical protein